MNPNLANSEVFEQEAGAMSDADVQELYNPSMSATRDPGAEIIGGLVGGVIGGIIGGRGPGGPGGGHGGGGHGGPGGGHGGGGHGGPGGGHGGPGGPGGPGGGGQVTCFAQDWRRQTYRASGFRWNWQAVQERAMDKCESYSGRRCRALGCR